MEPTTPTPEELLRDGSTPGLAADVIRVALDFLWDIDLEDLYPADAERVSMARQVLETQVRS